MKFGKKASDVAPDAIDARYEGYCVACEDKIIPGERIKYSDLDGVFIHEECS